MDTRKYCVTYHPIKGDSMTSKLYFTISEPGLIARDVPTLKDGTYDEGVIIDQVMRQFKEFYAEITTEETIIIPEVVSISRVPLYDTSNVDPQDPKIRKTMTEYMDHADSMEELLLSLLAEGETFTDEELQYLIDRVGDTEYLAPEDLHREFETEFPMWAGTTRFIRLIKKDDNLPVYIAFRTIDRVEQKIGYTLVTLTERAYCVKESADDIERCAREYYQTTFGVSENTDLPGRFDLLEPKYGDTDE